jgi:hypothetical protein
MEPRCSRASASQSAGVCVDRFPGHVILYRHAPAGLPFLWETDDQPPGRWHAAGEGPAHHLADTPDGAWAEFVRHEGISAAEELAGINRAIWAVEVPEAVRSMSQAPNLPPETLVGSLGSHKACQAEARRLRGEEAVAMRAPSAAIIPGGARGWRVEGGLQLGSPRDGEVFVLFGSRPDLIGWQVVDSGRPSPDLLSRVRPLGP